MSEKVTAEYVLNVSKLNILHIAYMLRIHNNSSRASTFKVKNLLNAQWRLATLM